MPYVLQNAQCCARKWDVGAVYMVLLSSKMGFEVKTLKRITWIKGKEKHNKYALFTDIQYVECEIP